VVKGPVDLEPLAVLPLYVVYVVSGDGVK